MKIGVEEGDMCGRDGCDGIIEFPPVENCTCFQVAPCWRCVSNRPECNKCLEYVDE